MSVINYENAPLLHELFNYVLNSYRDVTGWGWLQYGGFAAQHVCSGANVPWSNKNEGTVAPTLCAQDYCAPKIYVFFIQVSLMDHQ